MGQHKLPHERHTFGVVTFGRQLARGAGLGVILGTLLIGVGVLRAAVLLLIGGHLSAPTSEDARLAAFYIGGFGLAGAMVGAILPRLRTVVGSYIAFSVAGMIVMTAILASAKGGLKAYDRLEWMLLILLGTMFGCAFAYGWTKRA